MRNATKNAKLILSAAIASTLGYPVVAHAIDIIKADNTTALNTTTAWVGGTVPGASDVAVWNNNVTTAGLAAIPSVGSAFSWQGIRIANPSGAVTLGPTNAGFAITLGTAGIDMSATTVNATINTSLVAGTTQAWVGNSGDRKSVV